MNWPIIFALAIALSSVAFAGRCDEAYSHCMNQGGGPTFCSRVYSYCSEQGGNDNDNEGENKFKVYFELIKKNGSLMASKSIIVFASDAEEAAEKAAQENTCNYHSGYCGGGYWTFHLLRVDNLSEGNSDEEPEENDSEETEESEGDEEQLSSCYDKCQDRLDRCLSNNYDGNVCVNPHNNCMSNCRR